MDSNQIINEYINNSRVVTNSYFYLEARYRIPYDFIKKNKDVPFDYPELVLCYSLKKTCEQIRINSHNSYLIYDVAIGRYLNNMTALILGEDIPKWNLELFIKKCYAEAYYSIGDYSRAYIAKLYVDEMKKNGEETAIEKDFLNPQRILMVLFQELFIMLHEISHYRLAKFSEEDYKKIINEWRSFLVNDDTIIRIVDAGKIDTVAKDELKDLKNDPNVHLLGNLKDIVDPDFWKSYYSYLQDYYSQDKNIEEIICDDYAMFSLLDLVKPLLSKLPIIAGDSFANTKELLYTSCYLALQNVNYLVKIETDARRISNKNNVNKDSPYPFFAIPDVQHRKRCLIRAIIHYESEINPNENNKIGIYWSFLAKRLDSKYDDFEDVFQGNYSCIDKHKLFLENIGDTDDETMKKKVAISLAEIMHW